LKNMNEKVREEGFNTRFVNTIFELPHPIDLRQICALRSFQASTE